MRSYLYFFPIAVLMGIMLTMMLAILAGAALSPQYDPSVLYSPGSPGTFLANQPHNFLPLPVLDLTGFGYMAMQIYDLPVMRNDGDIGAPFAHLSWNLQRVIQGPNQTNEKEI